MSIKICRICKFNYAVKSFFKKHDLSINRYLYLFMTTYNVIFCIAILYFAAYFKLLIMRKGSHFEEVKPEVRTPESSRCTESPSRTCTCSLVSVWRFLRCKRYYSGQIRDAAPCPGRWCIEGRSCGIVWCISPNLLSSRGRVRARRFVWPHAETAGPQGRAQAQYRCDGIRRAAYRRCRTDSRSSFIRTTQSRTRFISSSPKHRTRNSAQKKTVNPSVARKAKVLGLVTAYEVLRTTVIDGMPRPEGTAALRYHGMLHGLPLLIETATDWNTVVPKYEPTAYSLQLNGELVRLLANLVLRTHSELIHVY